jgi:GTP-binding protein
VATEVADVVLFVVDARVGVTPADRHFAEWLRRQGRQVLLVANKAEGRSTQSSVLEAFELGLGEPIAVSAEHGEGIADLMSEIADRLPAEDAGEPDEESGARPLKLAIVGRPNVGKSTLLNRLVGERMLTGLEPGLTRDAVAVLLDDKGGGRLVDTAGLRRRARRARWEAGSQGRDRGAEAGGSWSGGGFSGDGHDQDLKIAQLIEREGRACVPALTSGTRLPTARPHGRDHRAVGGQPGAEKGIPVVVLGDRGGAGQAAAGGAAGA